MIKDMNADAIMAIHNANPRIQVQYIPVNPATKLNIGPVSTKYAIIGPAIGIKPRMPEIVQKRNTIRINANVMSIDLAYTKNANMRSTMKIIAPQPNPIVIFTPVN